MFNWCSGRGGDGTMERLLAALVFAVILGAASKNSAEASDWPQWRGPDGSGISQEKKLPAEWGPTKNVKWKTPMPGRGHSSPIVLGKKVFLTTSIEGLVIPGAKAVQHIQGGQPFVHPDSVGGDHSYTLKLFCIDRDSGKILWEQTAYEGRVYDNRHRKNTYASSTPATDGRLLYAFFGSEGLYCYDLNGKLIWKTSLGGLGSVGMGPGTSPVLYENLVILQCDVEEGDGSFIAALDKNTGQEIWKVSRKARASWSTPILVRHGRRAELVASGAETVVSYEPATGKEIWRCKGVVSHAIPSPVAGNDMVFITAGSQSKHAVAVRLGGSGDLTDSPNIVWKYNKGTAYVPSPILYGDFLYIMTDKGLLTCLDARTGEVKYEGGRVPVPTTFSASPVAFEGKIFLTSEDGDTFIVKSGPSHEILGTNSLGEPVYASPAISDGNIFIRGEKHLFCISNAGSIS